MKGEDVILLLVICQGAVSFDAHHDMNKIATSDRGQMNFTTTEEMYNVIFISPSETGKTFMTAGLIRDAVMRGYRALFITMEGLVNNLHEKTSIIITTNKAPTEWVEILQDEVLVSGTVTRQKEV